MEDVAMNPGHPSVDASEPRQGARTVHLSRWRQGIGVLGVAVVLWAGSNVYDVVTSNGGPPGGGHRPPSGSPHGDAPGHQPAPAAGGEHDPSQFDHG